MNFNSELEDLLKATGKTKNEIAAILGISRQRLHKIAQDVKLEHLQDIAQKLGYEVQLTVKIKKASTR